jgi:hypothetical protein
MPWARSRAIPERTGTTWSCTRRAWPGAEPNLFLLKNTAAPCARGLDLKKKTCTMTYALVTCTPCQAPSSSCYLNRLHAQGELHMPKPLYFHPSIRASRTRYS